jgi:hypothetical protein
MLSIWWLGSVACPYLQSCRTSGTSFSLHVKDLSSLLLTSLDVRVTLYVLKWTPRVDRKSSRYRMKAGTSKNKARAILSRWQHNGKRCPVFFVIVRIMRRNRIFCAVMSVFSILPLLIYGATASSRIFTLFGCDLCGLGRARTPRSAITWRLKLQYWAQLTAQSTSCQPMCGKRSRGEPHMWGGRRSSRNPTLMLWSVP